MSVVEAIEKISFAEARTLSEAQALIAKHRNDLEAALHEASPRGPAPQADVYRALLTISRSDYPREDGTGTRFDKTA